MDHFESMPGPKIIPKPLMKSSAYLQRRKRNCWPQNSHGYNNQFYASFKIYAAAKRLRQPLFRTVQSRRLREHLILSAAPKRRSAFSGTTVTDQVWLTKQKITNWYLTIPVTQTSDDDVRHVKIVLGTGSFFAWFQCKPWSVSCRSKAQILWTSCPHVPSCNAEWTLPVPQMTWSSYISNPSLCLFCTILPHGWGARSTLAWSASILVCAGVDVRLKQKMKVDEFCWWSRVHACWKTTVVSTQTTRIFAFTAALTRSMLSSKNHSCRIAICNVGRSSRLRLK